MEIKIGSGIEKIFFGISQDEAKSILGIPNKINQEEIEDGIVYYYNNSMIKLKFDKDEGYKLSSIEVHHQDIIMFDQNIYRKTMSDIEKLLNSNGYTELEYENYDTFEALFCEAIWTTFVFEFGRLMHIEFSPIFADDDKRIWPANTWTKGDCSSV